MFRTSGDIFEFNRTTDIIESVLNYDAVSNEIDCFRSQPIEPEEGHRFQGDFYGLLQYLNVDGELFLETLYLNGLTSPYDYDGEATVIKIALPLDLPAF